MSISDVVTKLVMFLLIVFILGYAVGCSPQESGAFVGDIFGQAGQFIQSVFSGARGGEASG